MKGLIKNYSLVAKRILRSAYKVAILYGILSHGVIKAQFANYINNGSFEEFYDCNPTFPLSKAKNWLSIDSSSYGGAYLNTCNSVIPLNGSGYQYPKTGKACTISTIYCLMQFCGRGYLKNRLKTNLQAGKTYCVKFHVNITDVSPRGIDGFGIYFGNNGLDTITKCNVPLIYLNPQVKNPIGNVISDTMNWVPITGTFTANGTEKYALIGNFLANAAVTETPLAYSSFYPQYWTDVLFDDVSCIELSVPAYAGPDQAFVAGDSVFIGRLPDFAIDPGCIWYQLPNMSTAIDTISGLWVKPLTTTTYVVRQELECSDLKWDTVVIYANPVGLNEVNVANDNLKIYPVPACDEITLQFTLPGVDEQFKTITIYNKLGQLLREEEPRWLSGSKNKTATIVTSELEQGVYYLRLTSVNSRTVSKKFLIAR